MSHGKAFHPKPDQTYKILASFNYNYYLEAGNTISGYRGALVVHEHQDGDNQKFRFIPADNGTFYIMNVQFNGPVVADFEEPVPGEHIFIDKAIDKNTDKWTITPGYRGYEIRLAKEKFSMGVRDLNTDLSPVITQYYQQSSEYQGWTILPA